MVKEVIGLTDKSLQLILQYFIPLQINSLVKASQEKCCRFSRPRQFMFQEVLHEGLSQIQVNVTLNQQCD